jgi:hypothetical protein
MRRSGDYRNRNADYGEAIAKPQHQLSFTEPALEAPFRMPSRQQLDALMAKVLRAFPALKPGCTDTSVEDRMGFTCAFGFIGTLYRVDDLRFWRSNAAWCEAANRWLRINGLPGQVQVWTLYAAAIAAGDVHYEFSHNYADEASIGLLFGERSGSSRASKAWVRTLHADIRPPVAEVPTDPRRSGTDCSDQTAEAFFDRVARAVFPRWSQLMPHVETPRSSNRTPNHRL